MDRITIYIQKHILKVFFIILIIPIACYIWNFRDLAISKNPEDWGVFGDYIGGVYGVLTTILLFFVGIQLEKKEARRKKKASAVEEIIKQIGKIKSSKNKNKSVDKLQNLIYSNRFFFSDVLFGELVALSDHYLEVYGQEKKQLTNS